MNNQEKVASRLIYASAIIGAINTLLSYNVFILLDWIVGFISLSIVITIGLLVAKGYSWVKYLLLALVLLGLSSFSYVIEDIKEYPINGVLSLSISILQVIATVILFVKKKDPVN